MYTGVIHGGIGDFSDFDPPDVGLNYVVHIEGGNLKPNTSDPFMVPAVLVPACGVGTGVADVCLILGR